MRLRWQWGLVAALAALVPLRSCWALDPLCPLWYQRLLYPFVHASFLHWGLNFFSWVWFHRIVTPFRILVAWACAVAMSFFVPCRFPVLGFSVIIFFFVGYAFLRWRVSVRLQVAIPVLVSFFFPNIAVWHHIAAFLCGMSYRRLRKLRPHD